VGLGPRLNQVKPSAGPAPPMRIESRIGVRAPAEVIWSLLGDVETWPAWNPIYPKAAGSLRIGGRLELTVALPGEAHRELEPQILDWVPNEQILWSDVTWGGWVKTTRFIEIEEIDKGSCIVSNGELFSGFVARKYGRRHRRAMKAGYGAMSEAIKAQAERLWRDQQSGAK
jgi:hypothetical protein